MSLKQEKTFLDEVDREALQQALKHLDKACITLSGGRMSHENMQNNAWLKTGLLRSLKIRILPYKDKRTSLSQFTATRRFSCFLYGGLLMAFFTILNNCVIESFD